jgi:hypothetical protein
MLSDASEFGNFMLYDDVSYRIIFYQVSYYCIKRMFSNNMLLENILSDKCYPITDFGIG